MSTDGQDGRYCTHARRADMLRRVIYYRQMGYLITFYLEGHCVTNYRVCG
jgi:hypothetical protein